MGCSDMQELSPCTVQDGCMEHGKTVLEIVKTDRVVHWVELYWYGIAKGETVNSTCDGTGKLKELYSMYVLNILFTELSDGVHYHKEHGYKLHCVDILYKPPIRIVWHLDCADLNFRVESFAESQDYEVCRYSRLINNYLLPYIEGQKDFHHISLQFHLLKLQLAIYVPYFWRSCREKYVFNVLIYVWWIRNINLWFVLIYM